MIRRIEREELRQKVEGGHSFALVDALAPMYYAHSRLPGSVNITPERVDELAPRLIADRGTEVVVYCASSTCDSSAAVAERLVELGYSNVRHYADGKRDWTDAGLPVESGRASSVGRDRSSARPVLRDGRAELARPPNGTASGASADGNADETHVS